MIMIRSWLCSQSSFPSVQVVPGFENAKPSKSICSASARGCSFPLSSSSSFPGHWQWQSGSHGMFHRHGDCMIAASQAMSEFVTVTVTFRVPGVIELILGAAAGGRGVLGVGLRLGGCGCFSSSRRRFWFQVVQSREPAPTFESKSAGWANFVLVVEWIPVYFSICVRNSYKRIVRRHLRCCAGRTLLLRGKFNGTNAIATKSQPGRLAQIRERKRSSSL
eukprot:1925793-Rhodomonas_salina.2